MAAVFAFLGMLLISMLVALLAALQLGDFFRDAGHGGRRQHAFPGLGLDR